MRSFYFLKFQRNFFLKAENVHRSDNNEWNVVTPLRTENRSFVKWNSINELFVVINDFAWKVRKRQDQREETESKPRQRTDA